jgi:hypothetical protein
MADEIIFWDESNSTCFMKYFKGVKYFSVLKKNVFLLNMFNFYVYFTFFRQNKLIRPISH